MKRILGSLALALCLAGMAPSQSSAKIIVGLSSVNVAFLPVYVTEAKGFFKDEGLDVLLVLFNAGATNLQALIGGDVHIKATTGLQWPLNDDVLAFGVARGISNILTHPTATLELHSGTLLCIHLKKVSGVT